MLPPTTRELDACGIGFVADAQGRSSRAIVAAALGGLACVKHRGAVAADARTADGSGLLAPIPPEIFGGTLAPTLRIVADGLRTHFVEELDYGFIPAMRNVGGPGPAR